MVVYKSFIIKIYIAQEIVFDVVFNCIVLQKNLSFLKFLL